jgi:hypothetical protein
LIIVFSKLIVINIFMNPYYPYPQQEQGGSSGAIIAVVVILVILLIVGGTVGGLYATGKIGSSTPSAVVSTSSAGSSAGSSESPPAYSGSYIWGIKTDGSIYRFPADDSGSWTVVSGTASSIAISPKYVWTVQGTDLYKCAKPCNGGSWTKVLSGVVQVAASPTSTYVYYLSISTIVGGNTIYIMQEDDSTGKLIAGGLRNIAVGPTSVWGTNADNTIFYCKHPCAGSWVATDGAGYDITAGDDVYVAGTGTVADGTGLWKQSESSATATSPWTDVKLGAKSISAGKNKLWSVNAAGAVRNCTYPCSSWTEKGFGFKRVAAERFK